MTTSCRGQRTHATGRCRGCCCCCTCIDRDVRQHEGCGCELGTTVVGTSSQQRSTELLRLTVRRRCRRRGRGAGRTWGRGAWRGARVAQEEGAGATPSAKGLSVRRGQHWRSSTRESTSEGHHSRARAPRRRGPEAAGSGAGWRRKMTLRAGWWRLQREEQRRSGHGSREPSREVARAHGERGEMREVGPILMWSTPFGATTGSARHCRVVETDEHDISPRRQPIASMTRSVAQDTARVG